MRGRGHSIEGLLIMILFVLILYVGSLINENEKLTKKLNKCELMVKEVCK